MYVDIFYVVVSNSDKYLSPIKTYRNKGVAKPTVVKCEHAIAFSTENEPDPAEDEYPDEDEHGMMLGIRIVAKNQRDKLDAMSRIDFARMYTVEHNVKVYDFGKVHQDYKKRLLGQWIQTTVGDNTQHVDLQQFLSNIPEPEIDSDDNTSDDRGHIGKSKKGSSSKDQGRSTKDKSRSGKDKSRSGKDKSRDEDDKRDKGKGRRRIF
jgi:hypothetical protein